MEALIDIHAHLIPGVDDGPRNEEEMLALAQQAVDKGVRYMILTPHHLSFTFRNPKARVLDLTRQVQEKIAKAGLPLKVSPSQEVHVTDNFIADYQNHEYLPLDSGGKYLLIEFPWGPFPANGEEVVDFLLQEGVTPVIAHPERQQAFTGGDHTRLRQLIEKGAVAQVTAASLVSDSWDNRREEALAMIEKGLIHVVASDAHHHLDRPVDLKEAYEAVEAHFGKDRALWMKANAWKVYRGEVIQ